ncbi:MAG TPA: glycosyltransferase family 2 protein [Patescibacteria group bacterium]|nr:glycosyltransferase family 2 protein [Patescibacteria group bacterium]
MKTCIVIPNWNGADIIAECLSSLQEQTYTDEIIVVDNASTDNSIELINKKFPAVTIIKNDKNLGFTGGVNVGIEHAIKQGASYVALFNNDATADKKWLHELVGFLDKQPGAGIATCKFIDSNTKLIDNTGEGYSVWGLPFPRGRGESDSNQYDDKIWIFGASGGASLYRVSMLKQIGLFDNDFFAYYEDVDLSFRAQLAGWKVGYVPSAVAYHQIGATSSKIKGFTTYQTLKNLPLLVLKNVPHRYLFRVGWRYLLAHFSFFVSAVKRGNGWQALKGDSKGSYLLFTGLKKRRKIQKSKKVSDDYIWGILTHDLPPNAGKLRALRAGWWRMIGKRHE